MQSSIPFGAKSTAEQVVAGIDLSGRTMIVTGCNSGIGLETMRVLAGQGALVIGLARSAEAAREACGKVGGKTVAIACDLADLHSVQSAAQAIRDLDRPIDAIIANAGVANLPELEVRDGIELQFLVNHVGHFLLVNRLLDIVRDRSGRIVIVSSSASIQQAPPEGIMFDNLDGSRFYKPLVFYGQSKLANALFAKELSRRVADRGIAVNSVHPGAVSGTALNRSLRFPMTLVLQIAKFFMRPVPQGAATQSLLACSPLVEGVTGEYWADCQIAKGSKYLTDRAIAERLWLVSDQIVRDLLAKPD
jgi:WW domain-containing oxidoreductase